MSRFADLSIALHSGLHFERMNSKGEMSRYSADARYLSSAVKRSIGSTTSCTITEKALVGAFSVIVKTDCATDGALHSINRDPGAGTGGEQ